MLHEESYLALCYHMAADKPSGFCLGLEQYSNYLLTRFHKKKRYDPTKIVWNSKLQISSSYNSHFEVTVRVLDTNTFVVKQYIFCKDSEILILPA